MVAGERALSAAVVRLAHSTYGGHGTRGLARTLEDLWNPSYFRHALPFGLAALGIALLLIARRPGSNSPAPLWGLLFTAGALPALDASGLLPAGLVVGVALLVAGALVGRHANAFIRALLALPGALWIATQAGLVPWVGARIALIVVVTIGAALVADFDERFSRLGAGPLLLTLTAVGVYFTVPDTYQAAAVLGVALPLALVSWSRPPMSLGHVGASAAVGVLAWAVVAGGYGRPPSIVGGFACLGLLVVEPIGHRLARSESFPHSFPSGVTTAVMAVCHVGLIYVGGRVAGTEATVGAALVLVGVEALAAVAVAVAVATSRVARPSGPGSPGGPPRGLRQRGRDRRR